MNIAKYKNIIIISSISLVFVIGIAFIVHMYISQKEQISELYNENNKLKTHKESKTKQNTKSQKDILKETLKELMEEEKKQSNEKNSKDKSKKSSSKKDELKTSEEHKLFYSIGVKSIKSLNMLVDIFTQLVTVLGGNIPNKCEAVIDDSNTELIKELFVNKYNQDYQEMGIKYNKYLDYYILVLDELGGHVNKGETNLTKFNAMFALKSRKTITQIWGDDVDAVTTQKEIQKMIKDICAINGCKIIQNK